MRRCSLFNNQTNNMKKNIFNLVIFAGLLGLSSCSGKSGFESDVTKMANYRCQIKKLEAKDPTDQSAQKELEAAKKDMNDFSNKMEEKYKDKKDDSAMNAQAEKIMLDVMAKCK